MMIVPDFVTEGLSSDLKEFYCLFPWKLYLLTSQLFRLTKMKSMIYIQMWKSYIINLHGKLGYFFKCSIKLILNSESLFLPWFTNSSISVIPKTQQGAIYLWFKIAWNQVGLEVMAKDFRHFVFLILKMKLRIIWV